MARALAAATTVALLACAPKPTPRPHPTPPATQPVSATSAAFDRAERAKPEPARIGDRCQAAHAFGRGSCAAGQRCLPFPGGYCTAMCERGVAPCADKRARCVDSPRMGEVCARRCRSPSDCRTHQGYICHPAFHVCTMPRVLTLRPPHCSAPAPGRGKWTAPLALTSASGPGYYQIDPTAALGADGRLVVAYVAAPRRGDKSKIAVSVVDSAGKVIVRERALRVGRDSAYDAWLARDRRGELSLVWLGFDGVRAPERRMQIGFARSSDGATWVGRRAAHDARDCRKAGKSVAGCLDKPMIAVGPLPNGRRQRYDATYVLYFSALRDAMRLTRSLDGGNTFSAAVTVASEGAYGDAHVDRRGALYVVFVGAPGVKERPDLLGDTHAGVYLVRSTDGGTTFSKPARVSGAGEPIPFYFSNAQVRHDSARRVTYVVYPRGDRRGRWRIVLASRRDGDATWTRRVIDDNACAHHMLPAVALDRRGALHVAWSENRDGKGLVAYTRCARRGARCIAVERVSGAPFASYDLVRHSPRWLGEYGALVIDAKRRRVHAVWTQTVDAGGGKVRARVFTARRPLR